MTRIHLPQAQIAIDRLPLSSLTAAQFRQAYQLPGVPVVLTGVLPDGCDWTLNYLTHQLGDRAFLLRRYGQARYQQDKRTWTSMGSGVPPESLPFRDYATLLRNGVAQAQDLYLAKCSIQQTPLVDSPAVQTIQANWRSIGLVKPASRVNIWVGPGGHMECLHYDPTDGTLIQLHGQKRVLLFAPSQTQNLYPFPFYAHLRHGMKIRAWFSQVYPDRPDFEAFPRLRQALRHCLELVLNPGELLYIPAGWWHEVTALGDEMVCSINCFWQVPPQRAWLSWLRWRAFLGSTCALPSVGVDLVKASLSPDRQQKIKEILQQF